MVVFGNRYLGIRTENVGGLPELERRLKKAHTCLCGLCDSSTAADRMVALESGAGREGGLGKPLALAGRIKEQGAVTPAFLL